MKLNQYITIGKNTIGDGNRPYIIAEMACAHDGDFEKAKRIIKNAANAQADCIQLQFFVADETVTVYHEAYDILKEIEFTNDQWKSLLEYGKSLGLDVFACTYDVPSVHLAQKLGVDGIKLNSADLSNPEVIIAASKVGVPITIGTGASTIKEIEDGIETAMCHGATDLILMYGVQNFPTRPEDLNISRISFLKEKFNIPVGYADHTSGDDPFAQIVDLIAVGLKSNVLEKHLTFDRQEKGIDYQAALEGDEFACYVKNIRSAFTSLGDSSVRAFSESDLKYRKFQKKSIVAARKIMLGERITRNDVSFIRNVEPGLAPSDFKIIEGKITTKEYSRFENIMFEDFQ